MKKLVAILLVLCMAFALFACGGGDSDTGGGKNQVGAFYQPDLVICDYDTLTTLPEDTFNEGVAEIIKHAAIRDAELFALLESQSLYDNLEAVIARNVTIKRDVIAVDERDTGLRQILNFGHTIAHGIEKHSGYSVSHGKAVAAGMVIESRGECRARITALLQRYGLPTRTEFTRAQLVSAASADKKRAGGKITVVALTQIGECRLETIELEKMNEYYYFTM
ncbi:MAG: 3-dehydroquinate synthase [Oscillospiraceae bacterium]|nr:3-dehydroquinate synthase [Oscillospiraceae bacterium]